MSCCSSGNVPSVRRHSGDLWEQCRYQRHSLPAPRRSVFVTSLHLFFPRWYHMGISKFLSRKKTSNTVYFFHHKTHLYERIAILDFKVVHIFIDTSKHKFKFYIYTFIWYKWVKCNNVHIWWYEIHVFRGLNVRGIFCLF